ncbi:MAG: NADP-dependent oxidoreductase [Candidatus Solibacter sp.]
MRAARIHRYGSPEVIQIDDLPCPTPGPGEVLVRVANAGVGPWDALIREKKSVVRADLPLTLGSDLSGIVEALGPGVREFAQGDPVYGVTNPDFIGACAEFAVAQTGRIARKPESLGFAEAASAPVVAVTAWQMLFDYAKATRGQTVLIHGAGGNVGPYAVQLAAQAGLQVFATASSKDLDYVRGLGASAVVDYRSQRFEHLVPKVDIVLDTVGGETRERSLKIIKPGGILVTAVPGLTAPSGSHNGVRAVFFLVDVTTDHLNALTDFFNTGRLLLRVGTVLPLAQVCTAHEMLAGAPHQPGKIVLHIADLT